MPALHNVIDMKTRLPVRHDPVISCPKCGFSDALSKFQFVTFSFGPFSGRYCMNCWASWMAKNAGRFEFETDVNSSP